MPFIIKEICLIINDILKKNNIELQVQYYDIKINAKEGIIEWVSRINHQTGFSPFRDKLGNYLKENIFSTINPNGILFYHYLPEIVYLHKILLEKKIRLYNLNKYLENDKKEYKHFYETFDIKIPKLEEQINNSKDNIFIWCLTDKRDSKEHWKEYAKQGNGAAISFEIDLNSNYLFLINLVKVCYQLDFMIEIKKKLMNEFNLKLEMILFPTFAKYFKHECKEWESEIRLCIDKDSWDKVSWDRSNFFGPNYEGYDELFIVNNDNNNKKYISVPLENKFFRINIKEIFCSQEQHDKIRDILNDEIKIVYV